MESSKAKYKIGTRVKYKLNNPNIPIQFGAIKGSYDGLDEVYYTISRDDNTTAEVPENLVVPINKYYYKSNRKVIINDFEEDFGNED